jgi:hypothetical protein
MGFINSGPDEYGIYYDRNNVKCYGMLGLYDSDTDLIEFIKLPERKRQIVRIDDIEVVKDDKEKQTIKLLYDNKAK